jgi:phosphoserine phosphatase
VTQEEKPLPLAVDLDGTLILTDMSWQTIKRVLFLRPWLVPWMLFKELTGKRTHWKMKLASKLRFEPAELVYHQEFLTWLTAEREKRDEIILCTASTRSVAEKIAEHVGLFDDVMASDAGANLAAGNKAAALVERYGERGFGYAGNSRSDLAVWPDAGEIIVVNAPQSVRKQIESKADLIFD